MSPLVNYNAKKLRELGFDAYQLKLARYSAFALARSGFSRPELLHAGFSQKAVDKAFAQLQKAGLAARLRERPEQPRELQPAKAAA
jgi:hypothetical protein